MTISTSSGLSWASVMASEEASSAGGMWSSVLMWAGTAADASGSCTLRSKMSDEAGLCRPGANPSADRPREVLSGGDGISEGAQGAGVVVVAGKGLASTAGAASRSCCCCCFFLLRPRSFLPLLKRPLSLLAWAASSTARGIVVAGVVEVELVVMVARVGRGWIRLGHALCTI